MPLAEDNDMVKAIPSNRTDEPLRMPVLPWRSWCDRPVPNAHRANATDKDVAIDTIPIANDILRRLLPAVCLGELTRNPLGARMRGHAQPQNLTAGMPQDQKSIQQLKRDRGDHEQIHRRDAVRVISKKRLPSLGWRTPSSRHVLGDGGLSDIDAELEQFAMNPRCTPKRVLNTHVSNELTNLQRSLWSATARSRFPPPIGSDRNRTDRDGSNQLRATPFVEVAGVVGTASFRRRSIRVITRGSKAAAIMAWPSRVRWMKSRL